MKFSYYYGSHEPIHTVLIYSPLSSFSPITIILLSAVLTAADALLADGIYPMASQL